MNPVRLAIMAVLLGILLSEPVFGLDRELSTEKALVRYYGRDEISPRDLDLLLIQCDWAVRIVEEEVGITFPRTIMFSVIPDPGEPTATARRPSHVTLHTPDIMHSHIGAIVHEVAHIAGFFLRNRDTLTFMEEVFAEYVAALCTYEDPSMHLLPWFLNYIGSKRGTGIGLISLILGLPVHGLPPSTTQSAAYSLGRTLAAYYSLAPVKGLYMSFPNRTDFFAMNGAERVRVCSELIREHLGVDVKELEEIWMGHVDLSLGPIVAERAATGYPLYLEARESLYGISGTARLAWRLGTYTRELDWKVRELFAAMSKFIFGLEPYDEGEYRDLVDRTVNLLTQVGEVATVNWRYTGKNGMQTSPWR